MKINKDYIDPSYLRYIHDGLNSGSIHVENSSSLPEGLTGLYESSFLGELNVKESQQLLKRFAYFSLLKKEVSCQFVAVALEEPESDIIDFISTYSKWFNSAQAGKYSIYHERLRTYILSSISQHEFDEINNRIIALSQTALANRSNNEWEYYALEYLSNHLFIASTISGNGDALRKLVYDTAHWNRQIEISKGFEWSKKMLNEMMQWAAKYDDDEVIDCALNKVDLHHMEQNDAPRIVEMVANNDIETALQRIEAFGSNDKEGLQRKFILYMLCLMELTFLDSKDKPFRKEAIEKLLRHLDESMPVDYSLFNCLELFPINFIYFISIEIEKANIESSCLFKWADFDSTHLFDFNSLFDVYEHSDFTYRFLGKISNLIEDEYCKDDFFSKLCIKLLFNHQFLLSIEIADKINDKKLKTEAYISIGKKIQEFGDTELANITFFNAYEIALRIENLYTRIKLLLELSEQSSKDELIKKALQFSSKSLRKIKDTSDLFFFYKKIANLYSKLGDKIELKKWEFNARNIYNKYPNEININLDILKLVENPEVLIDNISDPYEKSTAYLILCKIQNKRGCLKESLKSLRKARVVAKKIKNNYDKSFLLVDVLNMFIQLGMISHLEKDITTLKSYHQNLVLDDLSKHYCKSNDIKNAIKAVNSIRYDSSKVESLINIALNIKVINTDDFNFYLTESITIAKNSYNFSFDSFNIIFNQLINRSLYKFCYSTLFELLSSFYIDKLNNQNILENIINEIGSEISIDAFNYLLKYFSDTDKIILLHINMGMQYLQINNYEIANFHILKAEDIISNAVEIDTKIKSTLDLFEYYFILGDETKFKSLLIKVLKFIKESELSEDSFYALENDFSLKKVAIYFAKLGLCKKSLKILSDINYPLDKIEVLLKIIEESFKNGEVKYAYKQVDDAINIANRIDETDLKVEALCKISSVLLILGDEIKSDKILKESIKITKNIKHLENRSNAFLSISKTFFHLNNHENGKIYLKNIEQIVSNSGKIKDKVYEKICLVLLDYNYVDLFVSKVVEILNANIRKSLWEKMAIEFINNNGLDYAINNSQSFPNKEAKYNYFKGILKSINAINATTKIILQLLPHLWDDIDSVNHLLELHAINSCFFHEKSKSKLNKLNKTLDITWALDLKSNVTLN